MKYKAIIVSDLHLGTKDSKADEFMQFIEEHPTDLLILNGACGNRYISGAGSIK